MREPLQFDDLVALELWANTPAQHREAAQRLVGWSTESHPEDEEDVGPALMLVKAAWHLEQAGDADGAFELYRRAAAVGGDAFPDARCYLHKALLDRGDVEAAHELAEEVRRSRPKDPDVFAFIAEDYELAGDLARANRWANMGLRTVLADAGDDPSQVSELALALLNGRARVRQALGFPADEWDARRHRDPATW